MKENFKKESPLLGLEGSGGGLGFFGGAASGPTYVDDVFSTFVYNGTDDGSAQTITNGIDLSGEGGLVWSKKRSASAFHSLIDTERGVQKYIRSDDTAAETTNSGYVTQFNSDGYAIGGGGNINYGEMCSWTFRKQPGFLDIVTYTGASGNQDISHNLGSVPGMILVKNLTQGTEWCVFHRSLGNGKRLKLDDTAGAETSSIYWPSAPTSTTFTVGNDASNGFTNWNYVAYVFAHDDQSFGTNSDEAIIKCGVTGTIAQYSSADIDLGFEPQFLLVKAIDTPGNWAICDTMRGLHFGIANSSSTLYADSTTDEKTNLDFTSIFSTGYTQKEYSAGNTRYIYMAIRRPHKPQTAGTDVFAVDSRGGTSPNPPTFYSGFPVDLVTRRDTYSSNWVTRTRFLGETKYLEFNSQQQESGSTQSAVEFDQNNGVGSNTGVDTNNFAWMFRRAPGFLDIVAYTGNGSARTITHNLNSAPELMIAKLRSTSNSWIVYHKSAGATHYLLLNTNGTPTDDSAAWNDTDPTASVFTVGNGFGVNANNQTLVAYLFASLSGISKVGSYTGTGSNVDVDCGFTGGARFILIKRTDSSGDWYVWDTKRGIVSGNDPYMLINSNAAQVTNTDYVDPLNAGFTVTSSAPAALNANGGTYLFFAIA